MSEFSQGDAFSRRYSFVTIAGTDTPIPSIDGLGDPVIAVDTAGILRYGNERAIEVLGWDLNILGESVLDFVHPDDLNIVLASLDTIPSKSFGQLLRIRARHGRGTWVQLELRGSMQTLGDEELVVIVARDTTDRHQLDFDQGDVAVLRSVMNNMRGMVALMTEDGRVRSINGAVTRLLGHDPELIRNQAFVGFLHEDDREHVLEAVQALPSTSTVDFDARLRGADGTHHLCEFTVNNLLDDPVLSCYIVSAQKSTR
jgi:PAS domain S-box-containing protein